MKLYLFLAPKIFYKMKKIGIALVAFVLFAALKAEVKSPIKSLQSNVADSLELVEFTGKYKFKEDAPVESVEIKIEKVALIAAGSDGEVYSLTKDEKKPDTYKITAMGAEVIFIRDTAKKITGMKVMLQGQELIADKELAKKKHT
jgi:hypothetical protein